jgi:hypothetical protein
MYLKAYAKKTGKTEAEIADLWKSDCWMTAQEAKDYGFIDSISDSQVIDITAFDQALHNWSYKTVPTALFNMLKQTKQNPNNEKSDMKKIAMAFGKPETSTEEEIATMVTTMLAENTVLKDKIAGYEKQKADAIKAEATLLIDAAVKDGRIDATAKASYATLFESNHEAAKTALASMKPHTSLALSLKEGEPHNERIAKMSWDELDKGNHLVAVKKDFPEMYKEKFKAKFGTEPKN